MLKTIYKGKVHEGNSLKKWRYFIVFFSEDFRKDRTFYLVCVYMPMLSSIPKNVINGALSFSVIYMYTFQLSASES